MNRTPPSLFDSGGRRFLFHDATGHGRLLAGRTDSAVRIDWDSDGRWPDGKTGLADDGVKRRAVVGGWISDVHGQGDANPLGVFFFFAFLPTSKYASSPHRRPSLMVCIYRLCWKVDAKGITAPKKNFFFATPREKQNILIHHHPIPKDVDRGRILSFSAAGGRTSSSASSLPECQNVSFFFFFFSASAPSMAE